MWCWVQKKVSARVPAEVGPGQPGVWWAGADWRLLSAVSSHPVTLQHTDTDHGQGQPHAPDQQHEVPGQDGEVATLKINRSVSFQKRLPTSNPKSICEAT